MSILALLVPLASAADSLSRFQSGPYVDLGGDVGIASLPPQLVVGGSLGAGVWFGPYDDSYAIGRYFAIGALGRVAFAPASGDLRVVPLLEVRRGVELIVAGLWFGLAGGPVLLSPGEKDGADGGGWEVGGAGRLAVGGEFRRTRFLGLVARLDAGVDAIAGEVHPAAALTLGAEFSRPWKMLDEGPANPHRKKRKPGKRAAGARSR